MKLSRRQLLQAGLLAGFSRHARAQATTPARLVIVMECNGVYPANLLSTGTRWDVEP